MTVSNPHGREQRTKHICNGCSPSIRPRFNGGSRHRVSESIYKIGLDDDSSHLGNYNTTNMKRQQIRAVFLSALMVLSIAVVGIGFAGPAAAEDGAAIDGTYDDDAPNIVRNNFSDLTGIAYYQGQEFDVNLTNASSGDSVQLRRVDSFGENEGSTSLEQQLSVESNNNVTFETDDLSTGDYYLSGSFSGNELPSENEILNRSVSTFSINEQTLTAEFDVDDRTDDGVNTADTDFEFDSNRGNYPVTIHANGDLDTDDLESIFEDPNDGDGAPNISLAYTREGDDGETDFDEIGIIGNTSRTNVNEAFFSDNGITDNDTYVAEFDGIDTGSYEFTFVGTDSTATTTDSIEVTEANEEVNFDSGTDRAAAGDIVEFNVSLEDTEDTYVQFGDEESDFVDVMYIDADDEDEPVNVQINTRLFGTNATEAAVFDTDNTDDFQSEMHTDGGITTTPSVGLYHDDGTALGNNGNNFTQYLDALDIIDNSSGDTKLNQLIRPLQPTDYSVAAGGTTSVDDGVFDADPGGEPSNELGSKVLQLTQPEIGDITVHKAPQDAADNEDEVAELVEEATPTDEVAIDDQAIIQVEATGIYGTLIADPSTPDGSNLNPDFDRLEDGMDTQILHDIDDNLNTQITFEVEAGDSTGNQGALEVDLESDDQDTFLVLDEDNGQFFLVVDTSTDDAFANGDAPDGDTTFDVTMEYDADNEDDRFEFNESSSSSGSGPIKGPFSIKDGSFANYPYLEQGETISSSASFDVSPRSVVFDNLNEDQVVEVAAGESAELSGTTNVAPGSDATLRVASSNASSSFRIGNDVNISDDGSVTTTFDLSDQEVGDEFGITYQVEGSSADTADGVLVESVDTGGDDEETTTNETETETDGGEDQPADDGGMNESADDGDDGGSTDDGTPGFGAVVALVALIGAALLAVRRQN